jgi:alcohol dehydrogenase (cytochrome c)
VPIVVDGVMYFTNPNEVYALDARTGREIWQYQRQPALQKGPNRGVAVYGNRVYMGTPDAYLVALDARNGSLLWESKIAEASDGYWSPAAPMVIKDKVIVGIAPSDHGLNGWLDAYDANTGERLWRWHSIPKPGEPGNETWAGDSWKTGGGGTWLTGSYDPELNLLYWGTGNPAPDFDGDVRKGDNLYTECIVALDADTGKMKWYFQTTPWDVHDWDAVEIPVLQAAEMTPIDPSVGEFRVHYAGFFDPGFGTEEAGGRGARGVLEVRTHDTPFLLEHGQTVARLVYEPLTERPARLYGQGGSHYQRQGLKLSKHFKAW